MSTVGHITCHFTRKKETPGTIVYGEDGDKEQHAVGSLYVKKAAAAELGNPVKLTVTIEPS